MEHFNKNLQKQRQKIQQDIQQIKEKVIYDLDKLSSVFNEELDDYFIKVQDLYHDLQKTQYTRERDY